MKVVQERLIPFTAAVSIEAASKEIVSFLKKGNILHVNLIEKDYITLGGKGLCFSDSQLIKAASTGLGFPRLSSLAFNFTNGIKSLLMLLKIKKILKAMGSSSQSAAVGLRAGLAGAAVFANNDSRCMELLKGEGSGVALFKIADTEISCWFSFSENGDCQVGSDPLECHPSAVFTFRDCEVASSAIKGGFDHLGGPALGEATISGNLPVLDKIGYISRVCQKAVPSVL